MTAAKTKVGLLLRQLHDAVTDLADELREVAHRQASEHDVYYTGQDLAKQCDTQAEQIRAMAAKLGVELAEPRDSEWLGNVMGAVRRRAAEALGRRPASGLLLLRDLRQIYLMAEEANVHWLALGQVAQALRDHEMLDEVSLLHKQTLTQIKWVKTRLKETTPQVLCTSV